MADCRIEKLVRVSSAGLQNKMKATWENRGRTRGRRKWHQGREERNNVEARERGQRCCRWGGAKDREGGGGDRKFNCLIAVNYLIAPELPLTLKCSQSLRHLSDPPRTRKFATPTRFHNSTLLISRTIYHRIRQFSAIRASISHLEFLNTSTGSPMWSLLNF